MLDKNTRLLWLSAQHWLENWEHPEKEHIYSEHCPLCLVYLRSDSAGAALCTGCPVAEYTKQNSCRGSPWQDVRNSLAIGGSDTYRAAIEKEYRFLVSLALGENP